jgi:hypothetical protein
LDVTGIENDSPSQTAEIGLKVGVNPFETTTVLVVVDAHCPEFGVNV